MSNKIIVEPGERYNRWTAIKEIDGRPKPRGRTRRLVLCRCDCGAELPVLLESLRNGKSRQCKECGHKRTHGHTVGNKATPEYSAWKGMKRRCEDESYREYPRYGGRGITVAENWSQSFESFYQYMGDRPTDEHTLERQDSNGNYEPGNVIWIHRSLQGINRRTSRIWHVHGKTYSSAKRAAEANGVGISAIRIWTKGYYSKRVGQEPLWHPPKPGCWTEYKYKNRN